jgi:ketosteroid isomerase-like protein
VAKSDEEDVGMANAAFYAAFEARDVREMATLWEQSSRAFCIHPGWPALVGWNKILPSWYGLFSNSERLQFLIVNEIVSLAGDCAWVTCEENLIDQGPEAGLYAINHFIRHDHGRWLIVGHVSAPIPRRAVNA